MEKRTPRLPKVLPKERPIGCDPPPREWPELVVRPAGLDEITADYRRYISTLEDQTLDRHDVVSEVQRNKHKGRSEKPKIVIKPVLPKKAENTIGTSEATLCFRWVALAYAELIHLVRAVFLKGPSLQRLAQLAGRIDGLKRKCGRMRTIAPEHKLDEIRPWSSRR